MAERRDVWIQLFSSAVTGVLAGSPSLPETAVAKRAGDIADSALKELDRREADPKYQAFFAGVK
jgi:hypothetical protein